MNNLNSFIGISQHTQELRQLIQVIGPGESTVLVLGDSGTGKEVVANAIHNCSARASGPFVPVNCGAIPKDLLESELFGHRKGSFTGAISDRKGRFQLANKGTLFLDEIGDMSMELQVKLLRVLQERTIDPVGSTESIPIDVRIVAATHKNVEKLIGEGLFREDLFYRLNVMPIEITTLAERQEDIPMLLEYFAKHYAGANQRPIRFTSSSMALLLNYKWPGNVRELANLVDRYTALYGGQIVDLHKVPISMVPEGLRTQKADKQSKGNGFGCNAVGLKKSMDAGLIALDAAAHDETEYNKNAEDEVTRVIALAQGGSELPEEGMELKQHLLRIERHLIQQALERAEGNVSKTARLLSLQRTTLIEKINKYDLSNSY